VGALAQRAYQNPPLTEVIVHDSMPFPARV
jgi:hypothetical protein